MSESLQSIMRVSTEVKAFVNRDKVNGVDMPFGKTHAVGDISLASGHAVRVMELEFQGCEAPAGRRQRTGSDTT